MLSPEKFSGDNISCPARIKVVMQLAPPDIVEIGIT
jgi:hypothetical protein